MSRRLSITDQVLRHLKKRARFHDLDLDAVYVVGVSGGPDSAALLDALVQTGFERLVPVYVDHGLRHEDEVEKDRAAVRRLCERFALSPSFLPVRVEEGGPGGIEAAARRARRVALLEAADRQRAGWVFLAHHQDDNLETILLRLFGGAGAEGLSGIREAAGRFLRPFLGLSGETVKEYCRERGLPCVADSMNHDVRFERARFRRFVLPVLAEHFPGYRAGLARSAEKLFRDNKALEGQAALMQWAAVGGPVGETAVCTYQTDRDRFFATPAAVRLRSALSLVGRLGLVPDEHGVRYESVATLAEPDDKRRRRVLCGSREFSFVVDGNALRMEPAIVLGEQMGYLYVVSGEGVCSPVSGLTIRRVCRTVSSTTAASLVVEPLPGGVRIAGLGAGVPVSIRSPVPGDTVPSPDGPDGTDGPGDPRSVNGLLAKDGVAERLRTLVPVVESAGKILAVLGSPFGGKTRAPVPRLVLSEAAGVARLAGKGAYKQIEITVWFDGA